MITKTGKIRTKNKEMELNIVFRCRSRTERSNRSNTRDKISLYHKIYTKKKKLLKNLFVKSKWFCWWSQIEIMNGTKSSALPKETKSGNKGDFNCLNCMHSFRTKNKREILMKKIARIMIFVKFLCVIKKNIEIFSWI